MKLSSAAVVLIVVVFAAVPSVSSQSKNTLRQHLDTPEDMQKLLEETARNYRDAKSFRIEREVVADGESELSKIWDKSFSRVAAAPGNRYRKEDRTSFRWTITQSDGSTEWTWYPWRKQYVQKPTQVSADSGNAAPEKRGWVEWLSLIDRKLAGGRVQQPEIIVIGGRRADCMVIIGPPPERQRPDPASIL